MSDSTKDQQQQDISMSALDHLLELRKRIIAVLVVFICALAIGFLCSLKVVEFIKNDPVAQHVPWNVFKITDAFRVYVQVSFILSLVITIPFAMYQLYAFVRPGLTRSERRAVHMMIPLAALLLVAGLLFGYYILFPFILQFMGTITEAMGAQEMYGIQEYFAFLFRIVLPVSLLFQLPVVIIFLTRLGIINPMMLKKARKVSYLIMAILSAAVTPPDFISQILVLIPLFILFELSISLSQFIYNKIQKQKNIDVSS
ncbi:Sec-independent protein translocase, TatC subunit [Caldalkalibacillus thermarum TA2.A1]|uniref:Sec-independent protein translocase protein TatC n=1 Tax=Caldalkalibacillus thermarum (strain TA2.A1) TaxID=986075 RepID=F5L7M9_CALTT|nr:twin-arginine translocase subunit TatC [Caldalkalibacillus thermarum]EGL82673.1 Sec-independent protein translocase, TatC subunit [Caldalkalibacillus thermarum TA2.A1]QZT33390.1 twin-arginine translocase subunit TatC [Caldalkalibacillus thermarum TA2.A1]